MTTIDFIKKKELFNNIKFYTYFIKIENNVAGKINISGLDCVKYIIGILHIKKILK